MTQTPESLIADIDAELSLLRKSWIEAQSPEESARWWNLINKALDGRLHVMALRNAYVELPPPGSSASKLDSTGG